MIDVALDPVSAETARLRVESCGICGSDASKFKGSLGEWQKYDVVLGHEIVGIIDEIGDVAAARWGVDVGDRVAVEPFIPCGYCRGCLVGEHTQCSGWGGMFSYGTTGRTDRHTVLGGFSEYINLHPNTILHRVSREIPPDRAALFNPLGAGVKWAVKVPGASLQDNVLVLGPGQRGLASVIALRAAGVGTVIVTGMARDSVKLDLAMKFGADVAVDVGEVDLVQVVGAATEGAGVDVVVDTTPKSVEAILDGIECLRTGGTAVLAGAKGGRLAEIDIDRLISKEVTLKAVRGTDHDSFTRALGIIAADSSGDLDQLTTHKFTLDDAAEALRLVAGDIDDPTAINVVLNPTG